MATTAELLIDGFGRIRENVAGVLDGLTPEQATYRVDADANPVSWLVWHLTRIQDDHLAGAFDTEQVWVTGGWAKRFGLTAGMMDHGWGHSAAQVAEVAAATSDAALLGQYHEDVYARTIELVTPVTDADLDRIVDRSWTPHVTLAVRLVSVLDDDMMHVGQAAFVRGVLDRV